MRPGPRAQVPDQQLTMAEASRPACGCVPHRAASVELTRGHQELYVGVPPARTAATTAHRRRGSRPGQDPCGNTLLINMATGTADSSSARPAVRFELPAGSNEVAIWLPHNEITQARGPAHRTPRSPLPSATGRCGCTKAAHQPRLQRRQPTPPAGPGRRGRRRRLVQPQLRRSACSTRSPPGHRESPRTDQPQDRHHC